MSAVHFSSLSSPQLKLIPLHSSVASTWISFQQQPKNQIFENCAPQLHSSSHWKASSREYSWRWRSRVSFFQSFLTKSPDVDSLKEELLEAIAPLDRGAEANPEDQERVDQIASRLEAANKVKEPLKLDLLNGKWELLYTTSKSILQTERPKFLRPTGKIYQAINVDTLRAQNMETWPFFNQATANLVPLSATRVAVKFDSFKIAGVIPIKSRGSGRGQLEITYLDEELSKSRHLQDIKGQPRKLVYLENGRSLLQSPSLTYISPVEEIYNM